MLEGVKMRPTWDEYFMAIAIITSSRHSCRHVRGGSVIVLDNHIIGTGYNGAPAGLKNCIEAGGCHKEMHGEKYGASFGSEKCIAVHAEMNALANLSRNIHQGATLYTTIFPCPACAKNIIAHKIKKVVYLKIYDPELSKLSMAYFSEAGVEVQKMEMGAEKLKEIIFGSDGSKFGVFTQ